MTARRKQQRVPHPGWACCNPEQDLAGWIAAQRARVADLQRQAAETRARAELAEANLLNAVAVGVPWQIRDEFERRRQTLHGEANAYAQDALMLAGRLDRVEAAHAYRLKLTGVTA